MKLNMLLNEPLGAVGAPFGVKRKCNGLAALGGLVGTIMDWDAQTSANAINRQNAMETNQLNREINESQLAWAREQYKQEVAENRFLVDQAYQRELENRSHNEFYNSPAEQMRRLRSAGINPYLAMQGGAGSVGSSQGHSIGAQVGQNPHVNQPSMLPMQQPSPVVPFTGLGIGIRDSMRTFLESAQAERENYALASNIDVNHMNARANFISAMARAKEVGINEKWLERQYELGLRNANLEDDKFARTVEYQNMLYDIQEREMLDKETQTAIKAAQLDINLRMSNAQIKYLSDLILNQSAELRITQQNADTYASEVANSVIHLANSDAAVFEQLGLDKELLSSKKFHNWLSGITEGVTAGAIIGFGLKGARGPRSVKGFR